MFKFMLGNKTFLPTKACQHIQVLMENTLVNAPALVQSIIKNTVKVA